MQLPEGKTRLDMVRQGLAEGGIAKRGRLIVSINKLKEDPHNERRTFRNMEGLIASVKAVGLIEPITVTPEGDESYRIVTGHRRFRAAKAAGLQTVEVLIRDPEDERMRRRKSVISNVQREDVGPVELAEALQGIMDEDDRIETQQDLAGIIGKDNTWISGMLRVLSLPAELRRRVETSQLSIPYDAMIRIARLDDGKQQEMLVNLLLGGASNAEIRQRIDALKGKPNGPKSGGKPKRVYNTKYEATVIVQSTSKSLTEERIIGALQEAMGKVVNGSASDAE